MENTAKWFLLVIGLVTLYAILHTVGDHDYTLTVSPVGNHVCYFKLDKKNGDTWVWSFGMNEWVKIENNNAHPLSYYEKRYAKVVAEKEAKDKSAQESNSIFGGQPILSSTSSD